MAIGEFKSWAGFYDPPTWNRVEDEFIGQRPGLFLTLRQITGCSVTEWILVLWERSVEHTEIENKLLHRYGVPVRLYYLDEIFSNLGPKARSLRDNHLEALEKAVKDVRRFMGTCAVKCRLMHSRTRNSKAT